MRLVISAIGALILLSSPISLLGQEANSAAEQQSFTEMVKDIRSQIVRNPQYGVFDNIYFAIQGDTVILRGQASRPTLKSGLEASVKRIEGVNNVTNEIEVLPLSPNDDRIRAQVYQSIYSFPALQRYTSNRGGGARLGANSVARRAGGITADPPIGFHAIHIIVQNGNVTLTGVVDREADLSMAEMRARIVPGVFSVDNQLQVAGQGEEH